MNHMHFSQKARNDLWAECGATATKIESILVDQRNEKSPYELFYNRSPGYEQNLRVFGEMGVITNHANKKIRSKLEDRGTTCVFVGYANNHAGDAYRMFNMATQKISMSRDVIWLDKLYGDYFQLKEGKRTILSNSDNVDLSLEEEELLDMTDKGAIESIATGRTGTTRLEREMKKINTSYNPIVEEVMEMVFTSVETSRRYNEPQTFREGWNHVDDIEQKGWQEAIQKEFHDMLEKQVWTKKIRNEVMIGRCLVGSKWVFKKKKSGTFRARLVALGYHQIPGVDYTENFAPVINDVGLRLVILLWLNND